MPVTLQDRFPKDRANDTYPAFTPRMTQYIRTHCQVDPEFWPEVSQRFQISRLDTPASQGLDSAESRGDVVIEVDWHDASQRVVVHISGDHFFLTSPDRPNITLRDVLYALQYAQERIILDYSDLDWSLDNTLDTSVRDTPVSQLTIYPDTAPAAVSPAPTEPLDVPDFPPVLMRHNANYFC